MIKSEEIKKELVKEVIKKLKKLT